jgi:Flp pilus assembly protein TadD
MSLKSVLLSFACSLTLLGCSGTDEFISTVPEEVRENRAELAQALSAGGNIQAAVTLYEGLAKDNPRDPKPHIDLGKLYFDAGSDVEAEISYRNAMQRGGYLEAEIGLGRVALMRNDPMTAQTFFWRAIKRDANNPEAYNGLGVSYDLMKQHTKAQIMYRTVLKGLPDNLDALNNLALSYAFSDQPEEAIELMQRVVRSPLAGVREQRNLAIAYYMAGRVDDAVKIDRSVVETVESMRMVREQVVESEAGMQSEVQ